MPALPGPLLSFRLNYTQLRQIKLFQKPWLVRSLPSDMAEGCTPWCTRRDLGMAGPRGGASSLSPAFWWPPRRKAPVASGLRNRDETGTWKSPARCSGREPAGSAARCGGQARAHTGAGRRVRGHAHLWPCRPPRQGLRLLAASWVSFFLTLPSWSVGYLL